MKCKVCQRGDNAIRRNDCLYQWGVEMLWCGIKEKCEDCGLHKEKRLRCIGQECGDYLPTRKASLWRQIRAKMLVF